MHPTHNHTFKVIYLLKALKCEAIGLEAAHNTLESRLEVIIQECIQNGIGHGTSQAKKKRQRVSNHGVAIALWQKAPEEIIDEAIYHQRGPTAEECDRDTGHQDCGSPPTGIGHFVLTWRPVEGNGNKQTR